MEEQTNMADGGNKNIKGGSDEIVRVSISEAAKLFGVSAQTVRRALSDGELIYIIVGGRYKINFESLVLWSQKKTAIKNKAATRGIAQFVEQWRIKNTLYSPRKPKKAR